MKITPVSPIQRAREKEYELDTRLVKLAQKKKSAEDGAPTD